jgi:G3E family GTPase
MPSKASKRPALTIDTTMPKTEPKIPNTDLSDTNIPQEHTHHPYNSTASPTTQEHHHHQHDHRQHDHRQHDHAGAENLKSKSTASFESDLTTWALLSVDGPTGGTIRTICTLDREDGEPCQHVGHERKYAEFPRVDEPFEEITMEDVKALEEEDERARKAKAGEGWRRKWRW